MNLRAALQRRRAPQKEEPQLDLPPNYWDSLEELKFKPQQPVTSLSPTGQVLEFVAGALAPLAIHAPLPHATASSSAEVGNMGGGRDAAASQPQPPEPPSAGARVANASTALQQVRGGDFAVAATPPIFHPLAEQRHASHAAPSPVRGVVPPPVPKKVGREPVASAARELRVVSASEFQAAVEQKRKSTPAGQIVDLSDLAGLQIQGVPTDFGYPGSFPDVREVILGLNVSDTNFPQTYNMSDGYFRNCDFSGCVFPSTERLTLDGCDLSGASMAGTTQTHLALGDDAGFIGRSISALDRGALHEAEPGSADYLRAQRGISQLQARLDALRPTLFRNVNLEGATLFDLTDNHLVDWAGTDLHGVKVVNYDGFLGRNMDLTGMIFQPLTPIGAPFGPEIPIAAPMSAETVIAQAGDFVGSMLRGNNIAPFNDGEVVTIAIAGNAVNGTFTETLRLCNQVFGTGLGHEPAALADVENIVLALNQNYQRHNVKFIVDGGGQSFDRRLTFCQSSLATETGFDAFYGLVGRDNFISIGSHSIKDPATTIHEVSHAVGAIHPFETGVLAQECSPAVSIMCYNNGLDVMVPLGNNTKVATLPVPIDPGPQDHGMMRLVFGTNPNYVPSDRVVDAAIGSARLIAGDENFSNIVRLDTASLPAGVKYAVIDAASAIGTCYDFPCDPAMAAAGAEGVALVLYRDAVAGGRPEVLGSTLVFGGRTNDVFVDGVRVEPIVLRPEVTPEATPEVTPGALPSPDSNSGSSTNKTLVTVLPILGGLLMAAAVGIACRRKNRASRVAEADAGMVVVEVEDRAPSGNNVAAPQGRPVMAQAPVLVV